MIILKGAKAYVAPAGTELGDGTVWHPVTIAEDVELSPVDEEQDLYAELVKYMKKPMRSVMTFEVPKNQLERRAYLRMFFGIESGSLIHNGKKRRK